MAKLGNLTSNIPGVVNKFKSLLDSIKGPGSASGIEEALAKETDPFKIKLMEVELQINKLSDLQIIQNQLLNELRNSYGKLKSALQATENKSDNPSKQETVSSEPEHKTEKE